MDIKYIGGDVPWTLPFGDHFYSSSQASFTDTNKTSFISASDLDTIARRHDFEPLYSTNEKRSQTKFSDSSSQWMNSGVLFTDKTIEPEFTRAHKTDFSDNHGHTFCYLCSINQHDHPRTKPRDQSQRRKLIPYNNPKALKARSASLDRINPDSSLFNSTSYRFIVRTGHTGTRAKVFLYMYGTENDWTSINLQARENPKSDGFPNGSTRTFCFKGPDIGQLRHLNVNLVGARSDKAWFLKEIEITNLHTTVTWLCEFNCWLPKKEEEEEYHVKPKVSRRSELSLENLSVYILQVRTGGKPFAGTDSDIQIVIHGSTSQTRRLPLTSDRANLFEQNQLDTFAIVGWDIGDPLEITVDSDRSQLASDWDLKEMTLWKIFPGRDHEQIQVYFPFNDWLGKKASKLKKKGEMYPATDHHPRGPTCYQIEVKTGKQLTAGTDANVYLIIYGKSGRTTTHQLDNRLKNDFERNKTSKFTIMDIDVGEIDRIKIWHDDSGIGSAWFLDSVTIHKKHSTCRLVTNIFIERLEKISKALYRRALGQLKTDLKERPSSTKENDRHISKLKDYDDLGGNRGILRSPVGSDRGNLKKNVTWDKPSTGFQDEIDTKRMKHTQKSIEKIDSGHFEHQAYWISTHNYTDPKWSIQSIEERNSLDLDESTRTLLLSDRLGSSSKIKAPINERDDDVYEFQANRWLAKDEDDGKVEVILKPKSKRLSTHTNNETKVLADKINDSKKKSTSIPDKHSSPYDIGPLERSPRSLASLDRSPRDTFKRQEEFSLDKHHRPSHDLTIPTASQRELLGRLSHEPPYHSRSTASSAIDTRSSSSILTNQRSKYNIEATSPLSSNRDLSTKPSMEPPFRPKSATRSAQELSTTKTTRNQVYSSAYGTMPNDNFN